MKKLTLLFLITALLGFTSCTVGPEGPEGADVAVLVFQQGVLPSEAYDGTTDADIFSAAGYQNTNFGNFSTTMCGSDTSEYQRMRVIMKFDLSYVTPPDIEVTEAYLLLRVAYAAGQNTITAYAVTKEWVENQATWNIYSTGNNWTNPGGDHLASAMGSFSFGGSDSGKYFRLNLDPAWVNGWIDGSVLNRGIILKAANEVTGVNMAELASSENAIKELRPRLVVKYKLP